MLDGVTIRELRKNSDNRGWLAEIFRLDEIKDDLHPQMAYLSVTHPGISRGPHEHLRQTDYFCFPGISKFMLYFWDNRPESFTLGKILKFETRENVPVVVEVGPRIVHAYQNIGDIPGLVINLPNALYRGEKKAENVDEVRHESDPNSRFKLS